MLIRCLLCSSFEDVRKPQSRVGRIPLKFLRQEPGSDEVTQDVNYRNVYVDDYQCLPRVYIMTQHSSALLLA